MPSSEIASLSVKQRCQYVMIGNQRNERPPYFPSDSLEHEPQSHAAPQDQRWLVHFTLLRCLHVADVVPFVS